ncbi:putative Pentatricopeptide repeat-containing protein, mitochondrial [Cocos nucifera]|uniref:Putative Pentatricopeptide repeat-containing protein, mitochondrial n=1 Tax=Cocos nucifera TaxID=13894 RepID=A0A8K0I5W0_COCNU|nr:putative Pentatricopeptide repeat-containing protein, mitochondrial [Cocos nucifera]
MVDLLGKMKQMDRMWDLVHELRSEGLVTLETIAKIMRRLAGAGRWKDAVKLFEDLETMGFDQDTRSMNIFLDTLCKEKRVDVAREAFLVLKSHIPPDAFTFNIFVHGWCSACRIDEAMWTIEEMKKWGLRPSVITYSTILQAYCNQHKFQEVYDLLDRMVAEGCLPNVVTYTTIMNSFANTGKLEEALGIVKRMKSSGCKLDILFYNSLINILGKAGRLHEAAHIFDIDMQRNGIRRNLSTYNTMISIFCHQCQEQNALNVLKEMENLSCEPDLQTYRPLLKLCFKLRQRDDHIHSLLSDMINKHHLSLDLDTYTLLIHGLCSVGNIEWACLLFDEMIGREIQPRNRTCKLLMDEAGQKNMEAAVERIKTVMKRIDHTP